MGREDPTCLAFAFLTLYQPPIFKPLQSARLTEEMSCAGWRAIVVEPHDGSHPNGGGIVLRR